MKKLIWLVELSLLGVHFSYQVLADTMHTAAELEEEANGVEVVHRSLAVQPPHDNF